MFFGIQTFEEAEMDLRERLTLRVQARQLDRALAAGASAADSPALARRAAALVRADTRTELARSLRRLVRGDRRVPFGNRVAALPARADQARRDLSLLADRLLEPGPVAARGVALTQELLTDGAGPLFWTESADDLGARLRTVLEALEPRDSDPKPETEGSPR
jgi:hypothetical protein